MNWYTLIVFGVTGIVDILLLLGVYVHAKKIKKEYEKDPKHAKKYSESIVVGIVAGISVILLQKLSDLIQTVPRIDFSNISIFAISLLGAILRLIFIVGSVFFLFFYIYYLGLKRK